VFGDMALAMQASADNSNGVKKTANLSGWR